MYLLPSFFKSLEKCLEQTHPTCVFDGEANVFPAWCTDAKKRDLGAWSSYAKRSKKEGSEYPGDVA